MQDDHRLALIDSDRRRLVRAATRLLGPADAEDAVQDAYVRALEADPRGLDTTQAWLLTVVRNLAIDRLRRRRWLQQWLTERDAGATDDAAPSAETDAALAQAAARALRLLATRLTPAEGAAVLLHEVFEVGHAAMAQASGSSEAGSRQRLRRALLRLRQTGGAPERRPSTRHEAGEETVFRLFLQSLQLRDPRILWAMLRQPPIGAVAATSTATPAATPAVTAEAAAAHAAARGLVQVGGQLGLVLTLDGVTLCVLPLGVQPEHQAAAQPQTL